MSGGGLACGDEFYHRTAGALGSRALSGAAGVVVGRGAPAGAGASPLPGAGRTVAP